ncbi:MAG: hypothetical protein Q8N17_17495 [Burkholderiaceae bacterium]|nr:hypothetical protein [Burkholderiaceae bacterium]
MPHAPHLLIPFAAAGPDCQDAMTRLALPHLARLLSRMRRTDSDAASAQTLSPPHERALALAWGLDAAPDGLIPWAALWAAQAGLAGRDAAWACITPCSWQVGSDHVRMLDPQTLGLAEDESRALLAAMQPYFAEDGITLHYDTPGRWLASAEVFRNLATASIDRVAGRDTHAWMPAGAQANPLRRLQNEMQMLLYTHAVNDRRAERGAAAVNSFWISGTGTLAPGFQPAPQAAGCTVADALRAPALAGDAHAWAQAWAALDAGPCAQWLAWLDQGLPVVLTLCGEHAAHRHEPAASGLLGRIAAMFNANPLPQALQSL